MSKHGDICNAFDRELYHQVTLDVKKHVPNVRLRDAWVYHFDSDHWEFHYKDFYWHGSASGAFEARTEGWMAYLSKLGVEGYKKEDL